MPEFLTLRTPEAALNLFLPRVKITTGSESVGIHQALGRVVAVPITAPFALPTFPRSTVDGYAVRAADTYGASESLPAYLRLVGEVPMGNAPELDIHRSSCALIHTGGMLPKSADAVVMLEHTQIAKPGEVEIQKSAAPGENVIKIGEDIESGQVVTPLGRKLRPVEIGGLAALGINQLDVKVKPHVAILSTGDEVVPADVEALPGQVHDVNTYTLSALIEENGGAPVSYGILPDKVESIEEVARQALAECDMVVITAGSSASTRDLTVQVIDSLGEPGVLVHGINVRPGKPTILAVCDGKPVIGLPGNPVSAFVIAGLFIAPVIKQMLGIVHNGLLPSVRAKLSVNLSSQAGREDWVPVRVDLGPEGYQASPVYGKSNLIFTLVRADGLIRVPPDANGLHAGEIVEVYLEK